jgi:hypothetical protein
MYQGKASKSYFEDTTIKEADRHAERMRYAIALSQIGESVLLSR